MKKMLEPVMIVFEDMERFWESVSLLNLWNSKSFRKGLVLDIAINGSLVTDAKN